MEAYSHSSQGCVDAYACEFGNSAERQFAVVSEVEYFAPYVGKFVDKSPQVFFDCRSTITSSSCPLPAPVGLGMS